MYLDAQNNIDITSLSADLAKDGVTGSSAIELMNTVNFYNKMNHDFVLFDATLKIHKVLLGMLDAIDVAESGVPDVVIEYDDHNSTYNLLKTVHEKLDEAFNLFDKFTGFTDTYNVMRVRLADCKNSINSVMQCLEGLETLYAKYSEVNDQRVIIAVSDINLMHRAFQNLETIVADANHNFDVCRDTLSLIKRRVFKLVTEVCESYPSLTCIELRSEINVNVLQ